MVYATGGLDDGSFNDQAQTGIKKAKKELNIEYEESQPKSDTDFGPQQRQYAKRGKMDLVCCIGYKQAEALKKNAKKFSDQKFTIIDTTVQSDNVESYRFHEHKGSFQVGHLAGLLTTREFKAGNGSTNGEPKVGFVGGTESPLIKKFEAGYKAGVKHANPDINIPSPYVGGFNKVTAGHQAATSLYNDGVDIIYHAAGNSGTGVFKAAAEQGKFAIGVDSDQSLTVPNYADIILASMVKHVDTAVFNSVKHVIDNSFKGGTEVRLGLKDGGVETVYGDTLGSKIPEEVKSKLEKSKKKIINGEITVPEKPK